MVARDLRDMAPGGLALDEVVLVGEPRAEEAEPPRAQVARVGDQPPHALVRRLLRARRADEQRGDREQVLAAGVVDRVVVAAHERGDGGAGGAGGVAEAVPGEHRGELDGAHALIRRRVATRRQPHGLESGSSWHSLIFSGRAGRSDPNGLHADPRAGMGVDVTHGRDRAASRPPRVAITHPDKVLFPDDGITKADLAAYYRDVAPQMVPLVRDRPLECGAATPASQGGFFQKELPKGAPEWVAPVTSSSARRHGHAPVATGADDARVAGQPELHHPARLARARRPARSPRPDDLRPRPVRATTSTSCAAARSRSARSCAGRRRARGR